MLVGCRFDTSGIVVPDEEPPEEEPEVLDIENVIHVPEEAEIGGEADLLLKDGNVIDTLELTINGSEPPEGVMFDTSPQEDPGGPELAILHVRDLEIEEGAVVRVIGTRPLVILAGGKVTVAGVLDASAWGVDPGPGGEAAGEGTGAGGAGVHEGSHRDSGGGGAGHATMGAKGGDAECTGDGCDPLAQGGAGGEMYGEPAVQVLQGGSGGGAASPSCAPAAGAGGGAVQIYAAISIMVSAKGGISVGGGGGGGGIQCIDQGSGELSSGAGGGSGGMIFLQSRMIEHLGILAANGGGGGGGAGREAESPNLPQAGTDGRDGRLSTDPAPGGVGAETLGYRGGAGGALDSAPEDGETAPPNDRNAGGGGGAVGYIVLATSGELTGEGQSSPAATALSY